MLVCRTWKHYVQRHPCTCSRQVSGIGLRVAWLFDAAHLACVEGQSKKAKLKRIPHTVKLLLSAGSCSGSCSGTGGGEGTAARSGSSSAGRADGAAACGGGRRCGGTGCGGGSSNSSSQCSCAGHDLPLSAGSARWCQARVLVAQHRSPFERVSFPERVPLLALAAEEAARLSPGELRWLATVATSLDTAFLCPIVIRLTLPQPQPLSSAPTAVAAAPGAGPGPHQDGGATSVSASAGCGGGGGGDGGGGYGGGGGGGGAAAAGAAAGVGDAGAGAGANGGGVVVGVAAAPPGDPLSAAGGGHQCRSQGGVRGQGAAASPGGAAGAGGLSSADVEALGSGTLAVGSDGPHMYLVPTAAALRRTWPTAETRRERLTG
ncbi:hypothetical protein PLESTB_000519400 [Pleodorina starrii]|uniref:Uncharacterized protein n=1 Tax=Pleodorina starrii TaxID=330485 RepID=A0A9W6BGG0_9CHLO|nr:hypothetical protein PLESTB_000519400 [Pleodorina starrii]GLC72363.1 hypothetical protein PLESTF_001239700 [Pleodorina starrii]